MNQNNFVVIKLISGETVMASFEGEDEKFIKVEKPVQIKTIVIPGLNREQVTAAPYCQFSSSTSFVLEKSHIIYVKKLHDEFIEHYMGFIKAYDKAIIPAKETKASKQIRSELEDLFDDEEDTLTLEEVNRRLDLLEALANSDTEDEDPFVDDYTESEDSIFIDGNDTKH